MFAHTSAFHHHRQKDAFEVVYFQVRLLDGVKACAHKVLAQQIGRMKMTSDAV